MTQSTNHYSEVASNYESAFFYNSSEYQSFIINALLEEFGIDPTQQSVRYSAPTTSSTDRPLVVCLLTLHLPLSHIQAYRIADLGGGTGNFTQALITAANIPSPPAFCVDNSAAMLQKASQHPNVEPVLMDAVSFSLSTQPTYSLYTCHRVLLKEVIHHIPKNQRMKMFRGMAAHLPPGAIVTIITRPQYPQYPLFQKAMEIWAANQPDWKDVVEEMKEAGLHGVKVTLRRYEATLKKETWFDMVRNRFWSTFSHCTDEELKCGVEELEGKYLDEENAEFLDELVFLTAVVGQKDEEGA